MEVDVKRGVRELTAKELVDAFERSPPGHPDRAECRTEIMRRLKQVRPHVPGDGCSSKDDCG